MHTFVGAVRFLRVCFIPQSRGAGVRVCARKHHSSRLCCRGMSRPALDAFGSPGKKRRLDDAAPAAAASSSAAAASAAAAPAAAANLALGAGAGELSVEGYLRASLEAACEAVSAACDDATDAVSLLYKQLRACRARARTNGCAANGCVLRGGAPARRPRARSAAAPCHAPPPALAARHLAPPLQARKRKTCGTPSARSRSARTARARGACGTCA